MSHKQITIYDIAREAGVSASTVSRILTNSAGVKPEKRQRVMELVEKYHFRPNAMAKGLSESRSKLIGMLCPDVCNPYFSSVYAECEQVAYEAGYTVVLNNTAAKLEREIAFMQRMSGYRVESMIICGGVADWITPPENYMRTLTHCARQMPVVIAGQRPEMEECNQIVLDHAGGMRQAMRHLYSLGHRRIAFLYSHEHIYQTAAKKAAYCQVLSELCLPVREEYLLNIVTMDVQSGFRGMNQLLALPEPPTAVIVTNDMMCVGALQAVNRLGYSVPDDFSLIGFDDVYLTELTQPHLSSIHLDYVEYGRLLIDTAIRATDRTQPVQKIVFPMSLTIRESCRKIPI